jgi:probable F420-dependent oxidoreductase
VPIADGLALDTGVSAFPTDDGMHPGALARLVEERGHRWLFFSEHTHIPAVRTTPFPGGEPLPRKYAHNLDLFVALTAAAAATTSLRIGSGICLLMQRDPIITAKAAASLDQLSGGRLELGVGAGWNREEMRNHGIDPRRRFDVLRERVEAMRAIWTEDEASYDGEHVSFERIWSWPKPVQRQGPPVLIGGNGPTVLDRVLAFGDGWLPSHAPDVGARIRELRARDRDAGRRSIVVISSILPDPRLIETYAEAGVDRVHFALPAAQRRPVEARLDAIETAVADVLGT